MSNLLDKIIIGNDDLHTSGFSFLGTIFAEFYGDFLHAFQHAPGWKYIKGSDITKTY